MYEWIHEHLTSLLTILASVGVVTFVGSLVALPIIVAKMPADYFVRPRKRVLPWRTERPVRNTLLVLGRNALGVVLVMGGIAMLVLPGQGLLTIAIGLLLIDFPHKRALEAWILSWKPILKGINWLREKAKEPPLQLSALGLDQLDVKD